MTNNGLSLQRRGLLETKFVLDLSSNKDYKPNELIINWSKIYHPQVPGSPLNGPTISLVIHPP